MKKGISLLLMVLLALSSHASAAVAVNGLCTALIGENGKAIVAPGVYEQIVPLTGELFAARGAQGGYCLLDDGGNELTEREYSYFEASEENILFEKDGKYGVMNRDLEIVVPCEYTCIVENGEGGFLALRSDLWDDYPDGVYRIDADGRVTPTGIKVASGLERFHDGLSPALSTEKGRYGYLNPQGQWGIRPQFDYADGFSGGLAWVTLDSGSGLIDTDGAWKISPKYDYILRSTSDQGRILGFQYGTGVDVFRESPLKLIFSCEVSSGSAYFSMETNGLIAYEKDQTRILDDNGREIMCLSPSAWVSNCGKSHLIIGEGTFGEENVFCVNMNGEAVTKRYQDMCFLDESEDVTRLIVRRFTLLSAGDCDVSSIRCGVIDTQGNEILPLAYSNITSPAEGWILAEKDGRIELYAPDGALVWNYKI